ncbi:MAG TPA: DUF6209 family protein [Chloroflexota bacterium]|jgi:hypothetical protein|nr:DUF6209 family protein [Chloroflexota bacterium]
MTEQSRWNRTRTTGGAAAGRPRVTTGKPAGAGKTTGGARPAARTPKAGSAMAAGGTTGAKSAVGARSAPTAKSSAARKGSAGAAGAATIRFLPDWREEVTGDVRAGGRLQVEYALDRLPGDGAARAARQQGIVAEVRFGPGGQHHTGRVTGGKFEVTVPDDANEVMIWFYRTDVGATSWDSRFGENYRFPISRGAAGAKARTTSAGKTPNRRAAPAA